MEGPSSPPPRAPLRDLSQARRPHLHPTRAPPGRGVQGRARRRRRDARRRHVVQLLLQARGRLPLRRHLRGRPKEHRPRRGHRRDRAGRLDRLRPPRHAVGARLQSHGGVPVQHAPRLCDLHLRPGVQAPAGGGGAGGGGGRQPGEGQDRVRRDRRVQRLLRQAGGGCEECGGLEELSEVAGSGGGGGCGGVSCAAWACVAPPGTQPTTRPRPLPRAAPSTLPAAPS